jgi:hypothetical protein
MSDFTETCPCLWFEADPDEQQEQRCLCGHLPAEHDATVGCSVVLDPHEPYDPALTVKALRIAERWFNERS